MKEMLKSKLMVGFMVFMVTIGYINCMQVEMENEIAIIYYTLFYLLFYVKHKKL